MSYPQEPRSPTGSPRPFSVPRRIADILALFVAFSLAAFAGFFLLGPFPPFHDRWGSEGWYVRRGPSLVIDLAAALVAVAIAWFSLGPGTRHRDLLVSVRTWFSAHGGRRWLRLLGCLAAVVPAATWVAAGVTSDLVFLLLLVLPNAALAVLFSFVARPR